MSDEIGPPGYTFIDSSPTFIMKNEFYEFYTNLPRMEIVKDFYVPGYTEYFQWLGNVRVFPSVKFLESVPTVLQPFVDNVRIPFYVIPLHLKNQCYGFVFKGAHGIKCTPRFCTYSWLLPNMHRLKKGVPICIVEGFKDAYTLSMAGIPTIPMLTSGLPDDFYNVLAKLESKVLFIPDNDADVKKTQDFVKAFSDKANKFQLPWDWYKLNRVKDLGDFFLPEKKEDALYETKQIIKIYKTIR